ncbi:MAG TPA: hypothetical protein VNA30_00155 [Mycobacteriales bacterium]|nr:hypothetical protein [Mycobacteriales bacterium]
MPDRPSRTSASAEDLIAVVRIHADRVHDAVRRLRCEPAAAPTVVETSALDLVDEVADRPRHVGDPVGWWFARARVLGTATGAAHSPLPVGGGLLAADEDQELLSQALDDLPEDQRFALLLRDSYQLPVAAVATALGTDADGAMAAVGSARLAYLALIEEEPVPAIPEHQRDLAGLTRLAEGGVVAARDATTRKHAKSCPACSELVTALERGHLWLAGLTVAALPFSDREALLARVEERARAALPVAGAVAVEELWEEEDAEEPPSRLTTPLLVVTGLVLALILGAGLGVLLSRDGGQNRAAGPGLSTALPTEDDSPGPRPSLLVITPGPRDSARPSVFTRSPSPVASPSSARPSAPPSSTPAEVPAELSVDPSSGPNGASTVVSGTGWLPGRTVEIEYFDPLGRSTGSRTSAVADAAGTFSASLAAFDPAALPGRHQMRANNGSQQASATYDATN